MIDEKGLCACMKEAWKGAGYTVTVLPCNMAMVRVPEWAAIAPMDKLPRKALALLVEHIGAIPVEDEAYQCSKKFGAQVIVAGMEQEFYDRLERKIAETDKKAEFSRIHYNTLHMVQNPETKEVIAVSPKFVRLVETEHRQEAYMSDEIIRWADGEEMVAIAGVEIDREAKRHLEGFKWVE